MSDNQTTDTTNEQGESAPADETFGWTDAAGEAETSGGPAQAAREIVSQIQSAVESVAEKAAPVARDLVERATPMAREIGARAAGLAAAAGDKAGPIAHKAADMTADAGVRLAERSRSVATDLRHAAAGSDGGAEPSDDAPGETSDEVETPA